MCVMRYDVNGNDRHLSCLNSVLLTDIATPLYVTKYILFKNCKKKALHLCLRGSILWCPGPNVTESLKTCRSDHILWNNWQRRFRLAQISPEVNCRGIKGTRNSRSCSSSAVLAEKSRGRGKLDLALVRY